MNLQVYLCAPVQAAVTGGYGNLNKCLLASAPAGATWTSRY